MDLNLLENSRAKYILQVKFVARGCPESQLALCPRRPRTPDVPPVLTAKHAPRLREGDAGMVALLP